ncbi:Protein phosphatase 1F [Bagarius yarrelli]|uniref:Protein phosphatase 1F n=1 Tax=Bagarius yarrelli TaxID=175774 RepID=A0A556V5X3_BAGYA|nr:Protein phosphatase 1F [Bagarius yarrelli]
MGMNEQDGAQSFLKSFLEEFVNPLGHDDPLPLAPLSRVVTLEEVKGESLDLGLRLLSASFLYLPHGRLPVHDRPIVLPTSFRWEFISFTELMKDDLSPFYCPKDPDQQQGAEAEVVLLQSEPVQRLFINKLREVAIALQKQPVNPTPHSSCSRLCSVHAIRNTRRKMEDRHVILPEFNQLFGLQDGVEREYYAVFDGHGGVDAATYSSTHLHRMRSGSTGVAVLLANDWLTVSWLGDSQAMLVRKGEPVILMDPHKPDREDEKKRIEDLGGCIAFMGCWRVNGTYAVSRAIGDFDQKPYVSNAADCSSIQLSGDEDYILLACDGFFDVLQPADVPPLVLEALRDAGGSGQDVAQSLVAQAKAAGSSDNITVLLVFLREPRDLLLSDTAAL